MQIESERDKEIFPVLTKFFLTIFAHFSVKDKTQKRGNFFHDNR